MARVCSPSRGAFPLTGMARRASLIVVGVLLVGCLPVGAPIRDAPRQEAERFGPTLVLDVTNRGRTEIEIGYEFEAEHSAGGGSGTVAACERSTMSFGEVSGSYEIIVDGVATEQRFVPPGAPLDAFLVASIDIDADGVAVVGPTRITRAEPPVHMRPLGEC